MTTRSPFIDTERCVACGSCENECPSGAIKIFRGCFAVVSIEKCAGCGKCAMSCPACIIEMREKDD